MLEPLEPLELTVARILHTMYCGCGKPMSEPPFTTGWTDPAKVIIEQVRLRFHPGKAKGTNLHRDNEGRTLFVTDVETEKLFVGTSGRQDS